MRGKSFGGPGDIWAGYVWIPDDLLAQLDELPEEELRVALYLHRAEHQAERVGGCVSFGEIVEHCGFGPKRTRKGLEKLVEMRVVQKFSEPGKWRLWFPPGTEE